MEFIHIKGATFLMGAQCVDPNAPGYDPDEWDRDRRPQVVTVQDFLISQDPVTVAEFAQFVEDPYGYENEQHWLLGGKPDLKEIKKVLAQQIDRPNHPMVNVSCYAASAYAHWAGGSLPTEAQWELAARGPEGRKYPWGNEPPTARHANYNGNVGTTTPVGSYPLGNTPEGVRDMAGNVWEWVLPFNPKR